MSDPRVWGVEEIRACSVCSGPIDPARFRQVWISPGVATDVLPLLVNACSTACVRALPAPAGGYVPDAPPGRPGGRAARPRALLTPGSGPRAGVRREGDPARPVGEGDSRVLANPAARSPAVSHL